MGRYRENSNWGAQNLVEFVQAVKNALAGVTGAVRYDEAQNLTEAQQAQGRGNICAAKDVEATTTSKGLMSAEDKAKIDGLQPVASTGSYNDLNDKPSIPAEYVLPAATASSLGGIIVGDGLDVEDGTVSVGGAYVTSSGVSSIADDVASSVVSSAGFITSSGASAIVSGYVDAGGYVTSSGVVSVVDNVILSGGYATSAYVSSAVSDKITTSQALDAVSSAGYATSSNVSSIAGDLIASSAYSLPKATSSTMGGVIIGSGISVDGSGVISVSGGGGSGGYVLPPATTSSLGGVIVGNGLSVVSDGTLSVGSDYVTSSGASDIVASYVSGGGYATSAYVGSAVSDAVSDKITSAQALQAVSSGGYATSSWVTSQGYATTAYVSSATVASAGAATSAGSAGSAGVAAKIGTSTVGSTTKPVYISAGVPVSMSVVGSATAATSADTCTGNAATATNASSLGGVAAASYALDANVVQLSGNQTIGGIKTFSNTILTESTAGMRKVDTTQFLQFGFTTVINGARLNLFGKDYYSADEKGGFAVQTGDGSNSYVLKGLPNGALTWDGKNVITDGGNQNIGGTKTFTDGVKAPTLSSTTDSSTSVATTAWVTSKLEAGFVGGTYPTIKRPDKTTGLLFLGGDGTSAADGCKMYMYGGSRSTDPGAFLLQPGKTGAYKQFYGKPDGTFTWNGQNIQVGSDERIKTAIGDFPDDVLDAWSAVRWEQFKYREDAERKGVENCRFHAGLVTQHVQQAMQAHGVDPLQYGILCHEEWQDETDEEGNVIRKAGDLWMVRYAEALCLEAAYQRRRASRAEARLGDLERRLEEMEQVISVLGGGE